MPSESASPAYWTASIDDTTFFIDPQLIGAPAPLSPPSPSSSSASVESQELDWDIFPELSVALEDRELSYTPTFSNSSQQESRSSTPTPHMNFDMPPHRPRGRPKKSEGERYDNTTKSRSAISICRQFHNDSAMRSRLKVNTLLDNLWDEVPEWHRVQRLESKFSLSLSRADKLEVVISYMRIMQAKVRSGF